jgi:hypothetical protein
MVTEAVIAGQRRFGPEEAVKLCGGETTVRSLHAVMGFCHLAFHGIAWLLSGRGWASQCFLVLSVEVLVAARGHVAGDEPAQLVRDPDPQRLCW